MPKPTFTIQNFDELPGCARVHAHEFRMLLGISNSTFYRRRASGAIPDPSTNKTWDLATVRRVLAGAVQ